MRIWWFFFGRGILTGRTALFLLAISAILALALLICGGKRKRWKLVWGAAMAEFLIGLYWLYNIFLFGGYYDDRILLLIPLISIVCLVLVFKKPTASAPQNPSAASEAFAASPAVPLPTDEDEQVVLQRTIPPVPAYLLMALGGLAMILFLVEFEGREMFFPMFLIGLLLFVVGFMLKKLPTYLTVTNKRVFLQGILCRRVNLPLHQISSVSTSLFATLRIASSSGWIWLSFVPGYVEVYNTINALLNKVR